MELSERDPVSGHETTGHEWNGIKELDTPVPRGILLFLIVTHIFAVLWWFLMPAWPLGWTYTKGLLGTDQYQAVEKQLATAAAAKSVWQSKIATMSFDQIQADGQLMQIVRQTGHELFGDNCAACHRADGKGGENYPNLTDNDWIWGGDPQTIADTLRVGVNSPHDESRISQMPSFGRDQMLDRQQVVDVANYVYSLSHPEFSTAGNIERIQAGHEVFLSTCTPCHGEDAKGSPEVGAPNLTDNIWIYGGDLETIIQTVHGGRQGHMPTWDERLTPVEIKILALYVHSLSVRTP